MCGRYTLKKDREVYAQYLLNLGFEEFHDVPRYNIAPTQSAPVIRANTQGGRELVELRWGLIPSWAKDISMGSRMINARAETVAEKPSFRAAFRRRRCLAIADGYFEWPRIDGVKRPVRFAMRDERPFAFAALWETHISPDGCEIDSYTIITCPASAIVAPAHDRMPVILKQDDYEEWIDPGNESTGSKQRLLAPYTANDLIYYEVSPLVNSPKNDSPKAIEPLEPNRLNPFSGNS